MIFISSKVSDGNMQNLENRDKFFRKIGINSKQVTETKQVHGNKVLVAENQINPIEEADGIITNKKGLALIMKIADCIALAFYDKKHSAIGLIHIGYRGLENSIIKNVIALMVKNYNTNPKDLIVKISPSIGPCHYRMDIWKETENQLVKSGVLEENIGNPKICTYENHDYFSHRRSEDTDTEEGRFVTILKL